MKWYCRMLNCLLLICYRFVRFFADARILINTCLHHDLNFFSSIEICSSIDHNEYIYIYSATRVKKIDEYKEDFKDKYDEFINESIKKTSILIDVDDDFEIRQMISSFKLKMKHIVVFFDEKIHHVIEFYLSWNTIKEVLFLVTNVSQTTDSSIHSTKKLSSMLKIRHQIQFSHHKLNLFSVVIVHSRKLLWFILLINWLKMIIHHFYALIVYHFLEFDNISCDEKSFLENSFSEIRTQKY